MQLYGGPHIHKKLKNVDIPQKNIKEQKNIEIEEKEISQTKNQQKKMENLKITPPNKKPYKKKNEGSITKGEKWEI